MSVLPYWSPTTLVAHTSQGCSPLLPCRAPLTSSFGSAERKSYLTMMKDPPRTSTFPQVFFFAFLSCQSWASDITIGVKATLLKACFKVQQTNSEVRNEIWQKRNKSTSQFKPGRFFLLFCYPSVIIWFYWTISLPPFSCKSQQFMFIAFVQLISPETPRFPLDGHV